MVTTMMTTKTKKFSRIRIRKTLATTTESRKSQVDIDIQLQFQTQLQMRWGKIENQNATSFHSETTANAPMLKENAKFAYN
jgi:hypothetical protein